MLEPSEYELIKRILQRLPDKVVLSNRKDKACAYKKTVIRKMIVRMHPVYQVERFTDKQVFHENIPLDDLERQVVQWFPDVYTQMNVFEQQKQSDFKVTKKGKLLTNHKETTKLSRADNGAKNTRSLITSEGEYLPGHNRRKRYILEEGMVIPPLVDLGIFTKEGKIVRSMYDKYKQINRFLEMVEDVVKGYPNKEHMHIIDFGCGKSYLTFILYYYLTECKGYQVHMTGLDLKEDVIRKCNETAEKYHYDNLHFELGDINGYQTTEPVDMVVTLHACDTATDYALYNAVCWNAGIILSVPCCQKEVNAQIRSDELSLFTKYRIVKERMSALMTDAVRANVLECCGYKTQLLEFVDFASSPKNILIRAVKGNVSVTKREKAREEAEHVLQEFHVRQTLAELLLKED